jgi:hypothetical protein
VRRRAVAQALTALERGQTIRATALLAELEADAFDRRRDRTAGEYASARYRLEAGDVEGALEAVRRLAGRRG